MLIAKNWKSAVTPTLSERWAKCHYVFLMNKLTAIKRSHNGSEFAVYSFQKIWSKCIEYWRQIKPNDTICFELLELL